MDRKLLIKVTHLCKEYPDVVPLKDVNAEIYKGDVISIIGPSGTGKSTFLRCLNRLENPTSGQIIVDGSDVTNPKTDLNKVRQKMGMVFQSFNLFSHKRIVENIMMGQVDLLKKTPQEAYSRSLELLELVGLKDKALSFPDELSGGQKQRAAIARTLAMDPEIILFDEPTSALDPTMVDEVLMVIRELANRGLTMIIVTHEMNFAKNVSNRIFFMNDGVIYEEGSPEQIFNNPQKEKTIEFINKLKVCEIKFDSKNFNFADSFDVLKEFAHKNMVTVTILHKLELIIEEVCIAHMLKKIKEPFTFVVKYSQNDKLALAKIKYSGDEFVLENELDELQQAIIKGITTSISSSKEENMNVLTFEVK